MTHYVTTKAAARRRTFLKLLIRFGKEENEVALLSEGDRDPFRQCEETIVQNGVDILTIQPMVRLERLTATVTRH